MLRFSGRDIYLLGLLYRGRIRVEDESTCLRPPVARASTGYTFFMGAAVFDGQIVFSWLHIRDAVLAQIIRQRRRVALVILVLPWYVHLVFGPDNRMTHWIAVLIDDPTD